MGRSLEISWRIIVNDLEKIYAAIPTKRPPFLFVEKIVEQTEASSSTRKKRLTGDEDFFQGSFSRKSHHARSFDDGGGISICWNHHKSQYKDHGLGSHHQSGITPVFVLWSAPGDLVGY